MKLSQRGVGIILLFALILIPSAAFAQDSTITVGGSGVVVPLFESLAQASQTSADLNTSITGTTDGIAQLCAGQLDIATANRPISVDEDNACVENSIKYIELLIAHDIAAFIANPGMDFAQCLTSTDLNTIFPPSAQGRITNWNQVNTDNPDVPLSIIIPGKDTTIYAILDRLVEGDGMREDASVEANYADIIQAVNATSGALGVVSLAATTTASDGVKILDLNTEDVAGCVAPSAESVENRLYTGASRLFLYVNKASLDKSGLKDLLDAIVSDESAAVVADAGFTPITAKAYETDRTALSDAKTGREFSQEVVSFTIPESLAGNINIGGAAHAYNYMQSVTNAFTGLYAGVTLKYQLDGEPAGLRRLCNGEIDIAISYGDMSPDQAANCDANNIPTYNINLGNQGIVLLTNANTEFLTCLTKDQLATIWAPQSAGVVTNWNQVSSDFPETDMTLFAPRAGNTYTDLLLTRAVGTDIPARLDVQLNDDPLYRAAATANVEGALTYMPWQDYQRVLLNNQANIKLVAVDGGDGCVLPSPDTIIDGSFPLTRHAELTVSEPSLARVEIQSLLWYLAEDDNYPKLEQAGFLGVNFADLPALREDLQRTFVKAEADAAARAAAPAPESTQVPGSESTPEATPEATTSP